jgi:hypothetical protein
LNNVPVANYSSASSGGVGVVAIPVHYPSVDVGAAAVAVDIGVSQFADAKLPASGTSFLLITMLIQHNN